MFVDFNPQQKQAATETTSKTIIITKYTNNKHMYVAVNPQQKQPTTTTNTINTT